MNPDVMQVGRGAEDAGGHREIRARGRQRGVAAGRARGRGGLR